MSNVEKVPEKVTLNLCKNIICRLCGRIGGNISYIAVKEKSDFAKLIQDGSKASIKDRDKHPKTVCRRCVYKLEEIKTFQDYCRETQNILQTQSRTSSTGAKKKIPMNRKREVENSLSSSDNENDESSKSSTENGRYCVVYEDYNAFKQINVDFQHGHGSSTYEPERNIRDSQAKANGGTRTAENELYDDATDYNDEIFSDREDDKTENDDEEVNSVNTEKEAYYSDPDYNATTQRRTVKNYRTRRREQSVAEILLKKKIDRVQAHLKINMTAEMQPEMRKKRLNSCPSKLERGKNQTDDDEATTPKKRKVIFKEDTPKLKTILKHRTQNETSDVEENTMFNSTPSKKRQKPQTDEEDLVDKEEELVEKRQPNRKRRNAKATKESKIDEYIKNVRKKSTSPNTKASVDGKMKCTPQKSTTSPTKKDLVQKLEESDLDDQPAPQTMKRWSTRSSIGSTVSQKGYSRLSIDKNLKVDAGASKQGKDPEEQQFKLTQVPKRWSSRATVDKNMKFAPVNATITQKYLDQILERSRRATIDNDMIDAPVNSSGAKKAKDFEGQTFKEPQPTKRWSSKASVDKNMKFAAPVQSTTTTTAAIEVHQPEVPTTSSYPPRTKRNVRSKYSREELQLRTPVKETAVKKSHQGVLDYTRIRQNVQKRRDEENKLKEAQANQSKSEINHYLLQAQNTDNSNSNQEEYTDFILQPKYNDKSHKAQLDRYETKESDNLNTDNSSSENEESVGVYSSSEIESADMNVEDIDSSRLIFINTKTDTLKRNDSVSVQQKTDNTANLSSALNNASYTVNETEPDSLTDECDPLTTEGIKVEPETEDLPENISYLFNGPLSPIVIDDDTPLIIEMYGPPPLLLSEESLRETPQTVTNRNELPPLIEKPPHLYPVVNQRATNPQPRDTCRTTPPVPPSAASSNNNDSLQKMNNFLNNFIRIDDDDDVDDDGVNNSIEKLANTGQEQSYKCTICQVSFFECAHLIEHQKLHNDRNLVAFCKVCGKGCKSEAGLSKHITVHNKNKRSLTTNANITPNKHCSLCDETFETVSQLKRHKRLHHQHQNGI